MKFSLEETKNRIKFTEYVIINIQDKMLEHEQKNIIKRLNNRSLI